jgi:hypothetical protein
VGSSTGVPRTRIEEGHSPRAPHVLKVAMLMISFVMFSSLRFCCGMLSGARLQKPDGLRC